MTHPLLLLLFLPALSACAQDPDTAAGVGAHSARLLSRAQRVDRLVSASGVSRGHSPGLERSLETYRLAERRFRVAGLLPAGSFDAAYFHAEHALLDAFGEQLGQVEQLSTVQHARHAP